MKFGEQMRVACRSPACAARDSLSAGDNVVLLVIESLAEINPALVGGEFIV